VTSTVGKGSSFGFILGFQKTNNQVEAEKSTIELNTQNKQIRVLVAEDVVLNRLLMRTILDDLGCTSDIAANGKITI